MVVGSSRVRELYSQDILLPHRSVHQEAGNGSNWSWGQDVTH